MTALAELSGLHVRFRGGTEAVRGIDLQVQPGEVLCILGESGSGKSVSLRALMRLLPPQAEVRGSIRVEGQDVTRMDSRALRRLRGGAAAMVFQEPMTALDPVYTVGAQIAESVAFHTGCSRTAARGRALEVLELVRVPDAARRLDAYPHQLSGGLRQRVVIAMALACRPRLLLADEPTTALDATVQAQILELLQELVHERGIALVLITHDMSLVAQACDRVVVMYAGRAVETGSTAEVLLSPRHPYTRALLACIPRAGAARFTLKAVPGTAPSAADAPPGCRFHPRCPAAMPVCIEDDPAMRDGVACHLYA